MSTTSDISEWKQLHAQHGTKTTLVVLSEHGEACWSLLPTLVFLLPDNSLPPENTYSGILQGDRLSLSKPKN